MEEQSTVENQASAATGRIGTRSRFSFMELPTEMRVKIYKYILLVQEPLVIHSAYKNIPPDFTTNYPPVAILHTCKDINREAIPIFYSNKLVIALPLGRPSGTSRQRPAFSFVDYRWTTISLMKSLSFFNHVDPPLEAVFPFDANLANTVPNATSNTTTSADIVANPSEHPPPTFTTSGGAIISRFAISDLRYSPGGPDYTMALSLSNWVSMKVTRAELNAFERELEGMAGMFGLPFPPA
ncbi:hypothetical protein GLAREA_05506 [Glarea lozoyensis ATCC 20868]|uniref:2EXR domain-containing protein n=1 Tax=Glarea lozoyensis (strain ATCC 20868 / MF5171) TaxID=1116229 RepID=S3ED01_GLAL2|nr:uncharacterized protein GLAREA_05506 [Glarea lozoyensis ATCC 20868]EPE36168.1 hypothetical protein GLAREA_05506 [Glarea lozoyensis ATCC 20868]